MTALSAPISFAAYTAYADRRPRLAAAAAMVVALHLALLWLATRPVPAPVSIDRRVWIQLLPLSAAPVAATLRVHPSQRLPPEPVPRPAVQQRPQAASPMSSAAPGAPEASDARPPKPVSARPATPTTPQMPATSATAAAASTAATTSAAATTSTVAVPAATPAERTPYVDPLAAQPGPAELPADVREQALKAVGAIDRELRAGERKLITAPLHTPQARLERGFAEASAAVKPKWFESAKIELFSAPNDPKRIYRIITALGEYCLFYPDKASMSANSAAGSGHASFGQPLMGGCPRRF